MRAKTGLQIVGGRGAGLRIDSPLVSDEFIEEMKLRYGEDSNAFRIRVLGEFPQADDDTIIPFHLVETATHRDTLRVIVTYQVCGV